MLRKCNGQKGCRMHLQKDLGEEKKKGRKKKKEKKKHLGSQGRTCSLSVN